MNFKSIILFLFLALVGKHIFSQGRITNAYYLSKVLVQLNNEQYFKDSTIGIKGIKTYDLLYRFISEDSFRWNINMDKPYLTFESITGVSKRIKSSALDLINDDSSLQMKQKEIDTLRSKLINDSIKKSELITNTVGQINQLITPSNDSDNAVRSYSVFDSSSFEMLAKDGYLIKGILYFDSFFLKTDSLQKFKNLLNSYLTHRDSIAAIRSQIESYTSNLNIINNKIEARKKINKNDLQSFENFEEYTQSNVYSKNDLIYVSIENKSTGHLGTTSSSFKFPDETEVIDALAIFVAN